MTGDGVTIARATPFDMLHVIENMRDTDRIVFEGVFPTIEAGINMMAHESTAAYCGSLYGEPAIIWGVRPDHERAWVWLIATPTLYKRLVVFHREAAKFFDVAEQCYPHLPLSAEVLDKYEIGLRWLQRHGFVLIGEQRGVMHILERQQKREQ